MNRPVARRRWLCRVLGLFLLAGFAPTAAGAQIASIAVFTMGPPPASGDAHRPVGSGTGVLGFQDLGFIHAAGTGSPSDRSVITATAAPPAGATGSAECKPNGPAPRALPIKASLGRKLFWRIVSNAECRFGLPSGLMDSVILAESRYDARAVSPAGAAGLAQLMPATAHRLGVVDRFDPVANVSGGARYLRLLLDGFDGNVPLALAAYNAGPATVRRVRGIPVNGETPGYVRRVLDYWTAPGVGPISPILSARQTAQLLGFGPRAAN